MYMLHNKHLKFESIFIYINANLYNNLLFIDNDLKLN